MLNRFFYVLFLSYSMVPGRRASGTYIYIYLSLLCEKKKKHERSGEKKKNNSITLLYKHRNIKGTHEAQQAACLGIKYTRLLSLVKLHCVTITAQECVRYWGHLGINISWEVSPITTILLIIVMTVSNLSPLVSTFLTTQATKSSDMMWKVYTK